MKIYTTDKIRNVGLFGHGGTGKTSLAEAMLYTAGANNRIGKVDDDSSLMDYDPEEMKRKATINASLAAVEYKNCKLNIIDAPGFDDFIGEVYKAALAVDLGIVLVAAQSGVEVGTEKQWKILDNFNKPRLVYLSKLDKENINLDKTLESLKELDATITPVIIPWGVSENLKGVIDLLKMKAYKFTDAKAKSMEETEIPADQMDVVQSLREQMVESIVSCDEELMEKFFEDETSITSSELTEALKKGVISNQIKPLVCGMAIDNIGTSQLMDLIVSSTPSPAESVTLPVFKAGTEETVKLDCNPDGSLCGFVFKKINEQIGDMVFVRMLNGTLTTGLEIYNSKKDGYERFTSFSTLCGKTKIDMEKAVAGDIVALVKPKSAAFGDTLSLKSDAFEVQVPALPEGKLTYAISPKTKQDQEKMGTGLNSLCADDGILSYRFEPELGQSLITGVGDTHIDVAISRLKSRWGVDVEISKPRVPYRETIKGSTRVQGRHKKQTGGKGQFGDVWIRFDPAPGKGFEFVDEIVGGVVPKNFIPAVEKGLQETRQKGVLAGFPTIDFKSTLDFGSYHDVDSNEMSFKLAAALAFKKGIAEARPILLEPIYEVAVSVPDEFMGDIIGDLNKRRGKVLGMEPKDGMQVVKANVPLAEMYKYATDLKSMTQSRADFEMTFVSYEEVPGNVTEQVIKEYKTADEE